MALNAITSTTRRVQYTGNNSTTSFAFTFVIESASDIAVYFDGTKKTLTTHYTVTVGSDGTGSITTTTGNTPGTGVLVTIIGNRSISRTTAFTSGGPLTAASLENELNSQTLLISQLSERIDRAFTLPINTDATTPLELPYNNTESSNADRIIKFNSSGNAFELGSTSTNIDTLAGIASDITTVSGISSNVTSVASNSSNINTVAGSISNVNTLGAISSDVTSVAGIASNVTTVAGKASLITSDFAADMALVTSDFVADMSLVTADFVSDVNTLATTDIVNDLNLLATSDFVSDLNTLATSDFVSDLNALEAIKANVTTVANNISGINDFADRYRVVSSDPSSDNDAGDLIYNTTSNSLKVYSGSSFSTINTSGGISNVSEDTTPQLGGNLDANSNNITNLGTLNTHTIPSGTDTLVGRATTDTFTNKTFDANGTGNSLSNVEVADLASGVLDTDLASVSSSDDTLASAKAIKGYVDGQSFITASSSDTLTNKSGNISMFTNDSNFITASSTDTLTNKTATDLVVTTASGAAGLDVISTDAGTNGAEVEVYHNSSSPADNDNAGFISVRSNNDAAEKTTMTQIRTTVEDVSDGTEDARLSFFCMKAGTLTENARIESDGDFHSDGDVVAFSTTISDVALKSDIEMIPNALDKIDEVRGVTFTRHNGQKSAGIIAQELEKVLPQAVRKKKLALHDGKEYKTVEYDAIHGLLINCIKELKEQIKELKDGFTK